MRLRAMKKIWPLRTYEPEVSPRLLCTILTRLLYDMGKLEHQITSFARNRRTGQGRAGDWLMDEGYDDVVDLTNPQDPWDSLLACPVKSGLVTLLSGFSFLLKCISYHFVSFPHQYYIHRPA